MELEAAKQMCLDAMAKWSCDGWEFAWMNSDRTLGQVRRYRGKQELRLSRNFVRLNTEDAVRDTILHEIAHIKAGLKAGHGIAWKMWCRTVGCRPERCAALSDVVVAHSFEVACGVCEAVLQRAFRKPRRDFTNCYCPHCGVRASKGKLVVKPV